MEGSQTKNLNIRERGLGFWGGGGTNCLAMYAVHPQTFKRAYVVHTEDYDIS